MWPSFKTAFPKYLSDRQADGDGYEGTGGEWIRNEPEDASVSTTSIGGRVGWAPLPVAPRIQALLMSAKRHHQKSASN